MDKENEAPKCAVAASQTLEVSGSEQMVQFRMAGGGLEALALEAKTRGFGEVCVWVTESSPPPPTGV